MRLDWHLVSQGTNMASDGASIGEPGTEMAKGHPISSMQRPRVYEELLLELKSQIRRAQINAALDVTRELNLLYWHLGKTIVDRQNALPGTCHSRATLVYALPVIWA